MQTTQKRVTRLAQRITRQKNAGTQVFVCGVNHNPRSNFATCGEITCLVEPAVVLLEGATPKCIYDPRKDIIKGSFIQELALTENTPLSQIRIPSLSPIKKVVDEKGIMVAGFDVDEEVEKALEAQYGLENRLLIVELDVLIEAVRNAIDEGKIHPHTEQIAQAVHAYRPIIGNTINQVLENICRLKQLMGKYPQIREMVNLQVKLKGICDSGDAYLLELETRMYSNIKERLDGRTLIFIGERHLDSAEIVRLLKEGGIGTYAFGITWYSR